MTKLQQSVVRRSFLKGAVTTGAAVGLVGTTGWTRAFAADGRINFGDIGVGDPGGRWSKYTAISGWNVNLVAFGNAPSAILNVLVAGGGAGTYDVINIVGGMQKPLVENDLIEVIDTANLTNWAKDSYIKRFLAPGTPGFDFIGYDKKIYGVPTVLQGDSFAYLPEKTGNLNSYGALFDPKWRGFVALEDNYTTAGQKTALYLKHSDKAKIGDPANMTPDEIKTVVDFLIEQKKQGQFRVIWSSFEQAVNLLVSKEVYVMDCWEPMVFVAKSKGPAARFDARPWVRCKADGTARLYDVSRVHRLCQGARRRILRRTGEEDRRYRCQREAQVREGRHLAESLADAGRALREGVGALQGGVSPTERSDSWLCGAGFASVCSAYPWRSLAFSWSYRSA